MQNEYTDECSVFISTNEILRTQFERIKLTHQLKPDLQYVDQLEKCII